MTHRNTEGHGNSLEVAINERSRNNYFVYLATHLINRRLGAEKEQNQASKNKMRHLDIHSLP